MVDSVVFGERVQRLRVANGLSQADLSNQLGLAGNATVSKVETGRLAVDATLCDSLSSALGCSSNYLQRTGVDGLATKPWLRAYADAPAKVVESVLADNLLANEFVADCGLQVVPDSLPLMSGDLNDDHAIEQFAEDVRGSAGISEGSVVRNMMRAAERLGCIVLPMESELGKHLGLSQRIDGQPYIRIGITGVGDTEQRSIPGDRQRFTTAHELGHLAMHSELPPPQTPEEARRIERQAHRFAAAFLAPATPLIEDWQNTCGARITLGALRKLKATWGVSVKMLVMRFQHLALIDDNQARSLYRQISARGWNKSEPVDVSKEEPVWIKKALAKAFPASSLTNSVSQAASEHGVHRRYIMNWISWEARSAAIIKLEPQSSQPNTQKHTPTGRIHQLHPRGGTRRGGEQA